MSPKRHRYCRFCRIFIRTPDGRWIQWNSRMPSSLGNDVAYTRLGVKQEVAKIRALGLPFYLEWMESPAPFTPVCRFVRGFKILEDVIFSPLLATLDIYGDKYIWYPSQVEDATRLYRKAGHSFYLEWI